MNEKKERGQFYTVLSTKILDGFKLPTYLIKAIEPFAGKGDLIEWLRGKGCTLPVESYDIEPKYEGTLQRDTLANPPDYTDKWVLTNPPYLARNKSASKGAFDKYDTNDLYKCFLYSLTQNPSQTAKGGIIIIPAGFFLSPRDLDVRCRDAFLSLYRLIKVKYFEETVFPDTTTTVVAFQFERSAATEKLVEQEVEWIMMPSGTKKTFKMSKANDWIIGGDIYKLPITNEVKIRRHVDGQPLKEGEQQLHITLNAIDSGMHEGGRIGLTYKEGYVFPAKDCSRAYATLRCQGRTLSVEEQKKLCTDFNSFLEAKRAETWSMFLPQFRESKEYARKRIPFELAYSIVEYLISQSS